MSKKIFFIKLFILVLSISISAKTFAHCQIPCGIYGDEMRFQMLREDITTISKSIDEINKLSKNSSPNISQISRWTTNKENHASKIQETIQNYFLSQRIKPIEKKSSQYNEYLKKLSLLHKIIFYAMKTKQTTDQKNIEILIKNVDEFEKLYFKHE